MKKGEKMSEEQKEKIRQYQLNNTTGNDYKTRFKKGNSIGIENRFKKGHQINKGCKGRICSDETKIKISESIKKRYL